MALFIASNIVWPVAIVVLLLLLLCAKCLYAAMLGGRSAVVPCDEPNVMIDASSAPFTLYARVEGLLAGRGVPEQVIDGCIGLLKQYMAQGGVDSVEVIQKSAALYIILHPRNIVIKVK
ncbi:MAG: hypothetical protein IJ277_08040 [Bacteroidaceae bacterium]|nr:hypothetical protein [Bacteroidaceae bacterium]